LPSVLKHRATEELEKVMPSKVMPSKLAKAGAEHRHGGKHETT
jgi:hypothetical protein